MSNLLKGTLGLLNIRQYVLTRGACLLLAGLTIAGVGLAAASMSPGFRDNPQTQVFIKRMVKEHGFDKKALEKLFTQAQHKQAIIDLMERPAEKVKPWREYRDIFLNERRIHQGVEFMRENKQTLQRAYKDYGVSPLIVTAIIGVETYYGRNMGGNRVIDALSTLAFDYPKRSPFFTKELENFLLLAREQKQDPLQLMGSYAGAMGYGQFMPSSYRHYAVDYDHDGFADIWGNPVDAIGSVANYFAEHKWQKDGAVVIPVSASLTDYDESLLNQLKPPVQTLKELKGQGFSFDGQHQPNEKAMPLRYDGVNGEEYWLGFNNFYVITRYNRSHRYAMAVYQLSELIRERLGEDI